MQSGDALYALFDRPWTSEAPRYSMPFYRIAELATEYRLETTLLQRHPNIISNAALAASGDRIFRVGGRPIEVVTRPQEVPGLGSCQVYSVRADTWVDGPGLLRDRTECGACVVASHLYAVGGYHFLGGE